jgi:Protein of unknown function (DUF3553)
MRAFAAGDRVTQPQYGAGTVTSVNARHTVIDFDQHGVRTFVTTMVTLESTTEPAPASAKRGARAKRAPKAKAVAAAAVTGADE